MGKADVCLNCTRARCPGSCELVEAGRKPREPAKLYEAFGRRMALGAWAAETGISYSALYARVKSGMPLETAIQMGPSKPRRGPVTAFGQTMSLRAWGRRFGIHAATLAYRINGHAPALLPEGQAPAAPGASSGCQPGLVAPAGRGNGATAGQGIDPEAAMLMGTRRTYRSYYDPSAEWDGVETRDRGYSVRRGALVYKDMSVKQWASALGVSVHTIYWRRHQGWSMEKIVDRYGGTR